MRAMRVLLRDPLLLWLLAMAMLLLVLTGGSAVHGQGPRRLVETTHAVAVEPIATTKAPTETPPLKETSHRTPAPFTLAQKRELCSKDFKGYNRALRLMTVSPKRIVPLTPENEGTNNTIRPARATRTYPRIFCYVNTISPYHESHAQLVADTWGQRCDKLVFFSNDTGVMVVNPGTPLETQFPIIKMNAPADYWHLWLKHREVLQYIHDHYRHDYDWFYKADDDAYVVVDNLREYLRRPEIVMNHRRQPMELGERWNLTEHRVHKYIRDRQLDAKWWKHWDRWVFNSGGPGYAMNRLFLDKFVETMHDKNCLSERWAETQPEDTATAYCLSWQGVAPWDTRDLQGRPRWHATNPSGEYGMTPVRAKGYWLDYHNHIGGLRWGDDCCAPDSIGYHYIKGPAMYHMERTLYFCRESDDDVVDIVAFNRKYGLAISEKVLLAPNVIDIRH